MKHETLLLAFALTVVACENDQPHNSRNNSANDNSGQSNGPGPDADKPSAYEYDENKARPSTDPNMNKAGNNQGGGSQAQPNAETDTAGRGKAAQKE